MRQVTVLTRTHDQKTLNSTIEKKKKKKKNSKSLKAKRFLLNNETSINSPKNPKLCGEDLMVELQR